MVWLPDGEKISKIFLFVLTVCTNVSDRQTRHRMTTQAAFMHRIARQKYLQTKELKTACIWCLHCSVCVMDCPALRTSPYWSRTSGQRDNRTYCA